MSKPLVIFGNAGTLMRDYLRPLLLAHPDPSPDTTTASFPTSLAAGKTHLQVELEAGNADDYPVTERAQVRFNVWAAKNRPSDAESAASIVMAHVYACEGVGGIAGTQILGGRSDVIEDPDTGYLMCWFLARVNLLSTPLS